MKFLISLLALLALILIVQAAAVNAREGGIKVSAPEARDKVPKTEPVFPKKKPNGKRDKVPKLSDQVPPKRKPIGRRDKVPKPASTGKKPKRG
ncbi:hypothetical protein BDR26DRAFT_387253 [Obelidium mucronatum]|nr:hypothetical protein BDR26DRAFT_387253 [Obelidium mucronatum]